MLVNLVSLVRVLQSLCTHVKETTALVSSHLSRQVLSYQAIVSASILLKLTREKSKTF